jgi:aromatic ring hydroxylase
MFPTVIIDGTENPVSETYNRQGDEAFIIQPVSEFIIDTISDATDITFQYDNFDDIMTLTTKTKGGKTKKIQKIQKKSKTMRKKNKRIKKLSRKR